MVKFSITFSQFWGPFLNLGTFQELLDALDFSPRQRIRERSPTAVLIRRIDHEQQIVYFRVDKCPGNFSPSLIAQKSPPISHVQMFLERVKNAIF